MLRSLKDLQGYKIQSGAAGEDIGKLEDIYFDDFHWTVRYVVVDTGGWLRGRQVLLSPLAIEEAHWAGRRLTVNVSKDQLENSPSIDRDRPVSRQMEERLVQYYRWPEYWGVHVMVPPQPAVPPPTSISGEPEPTMVGGKILHVRGERGDPALRSLKEVVGYHIEAVDGSIGHADDLIGDDGTWRVRYLVVDTRNWLPGKRVLLAPDWIEEIDWHGTRVRVDLARDAIEKSPEFDPSAPLNRKVEERLYDFYGRPYYWL